MDLYKNREFKEVPYKIRPVTSLGKVGVSSIKAASTKYGDFRIKSELLKKQELTRIKPIYHVDKEKLYEQTIHLKTSLNLLVQENQ